MKKKTGCNNRKLCVGILLVAVIIVTIVVAVHVSRSSDDDVTIVRNMNPMLSFFHINDGLNIKWAHAVNSQSKLNKAINDEKVMFLEADVMLDTTMDHAIMAHPPATTSDITLREWLDIASKTKKGIKLDVKKESALNDTVLAVKNLLSKIPYKGPILLNCNILKGPNNNNSEPFNFNAVLYSFTQLETLIFSPGWTSEFVGNSSTGYSMDHVQKMNELVKDLSQFITFPVRASLVGRSKQALLWLLNQNKMKYSFTVWTSSDDRYDVASLDFLRSYPKNVFFDLPDNEIEILKKLGS